MNAYFPSEEVSVSDDLFPPTPMVRKDSKAQSITFWSTEKTGGDLDALLQIVEATALEPDSFKSWVTEDIWKHAREYQRRFATKFGELRLRITSDGLVSTEGRLITDARILKDADIEDTKLRISVSLNWELPEEAAPNKQANGPNTPQKPASKRRVITPPKPRETLE